MHIHNLWFGATIVFLFDQLTKAWAVTRLPYGESVFTNKFISLCKFYNESTFMLLFDAQSYNISLFQYKTIYLIVALLILGGILWVTKQKAMQEKSIEVGLALSGLFIIVGGLMGNLTDRIFRGKVIDFIKLNFLESVEPVINVADIMIYIGLLSIILSWVIIITKCIKN